MFDTPDRLLDAVTLLGVLRAARKGDFAARLPLGLTGISRDIAEALNGILELNEEMVGELERVSYTVGREGRTDQRASLGHVTGGWASCVGAVNTLVEDLVRPGVDVARVLGAAARGDLSQRMTLEGASGPLRGQFSSTAGTVNRLIDQLAVVASEVTRIAREVGTEGKLGGRAEVADAAGIWKDVTDQVNAMSASLASQVRNIAEVTTAVATGDLSKKITVDVQGEMLELKTTTNTMVDQLNSFASEVTRVAREVGTEGHLGGQAEVPRAAGIWRDLTDNVNQLAANLTTQVRAIAEVATAVTMGDLSRSITVQAEGELAALKGNINEMIFKLAHTTRKNVESDWLQSNLAKFTLMLQGQRNLSAFATLILSELAGVVGAHHGVFYILRPGEDDAPELGMLSTYAYQHRRGVSSSFALGEGLPGQCALEKSRILLTDVPGDYVRISSGLGHARPVNIILLPVLFEGECRAVIELASLNPLSDLHLTLLEQLSEGIGIVLNTLSTMLRTEELLLQSQTLTQELQTRQEELKRTNERLEQQNVEVEVARNALEEKAVQLALTTKYKSQFLANVSHELRTPLNSLLILANLLASNQGGNLDPKQVEFANTIHGAGSDLLTLINEILDLAKVESGAMAVDLVQVSFAQLREFVARTFDPIAEQKGITFTVEVSADLPDSLETDPTRLRQVLKNLLSNAFKFTISGSVTLKIAVEPVTSWLSFSVTDTGIGIQEAKQAIIFEAFQQADMTTSRTFGGTGLGLSISREIAQLLGGELRVSSAPGRGSTFTLLLPQPCPVMHHRAPAPLTLAARRIDPVQRPERDPALVGPLVLPRGATRALAGRHVLVVDDDIRNIFAITSLLENEEMVVRHAVGGLEAIELIQRASPAIEIVLMDISMPGMDGYQTTAAIRDLPRLRDLPIIALAARAMQSDRERCLTAGASDYVPKPVDTEHLLSMLRTWLGV